MWKELYSAGIVKIIDLFTTDGQFIDFNKFFKD